MYVNPKIKSIWITYVVPYEIGNPPFLFSYYIYLLFPEEDNHKQQMALHRLIKLGASFPPYHTRSVLSITYFGRKYTMIWGMMAPRGQVLTWLA